MIGLLAVLGYIGAHVLAALLIGRHKYGTVRAWWRS